MPIHEPNDEFLRPTNGPWKCQNCGKEFYTVDVIISHKRTCLNSVKDPKIQKCEEERQRKIQENFTIFKKQHSIK